MKLLLLMAFLSGCSECGQQRSAGELDKWDDVDAGVRCYATISGGFACVRVR